MLIRFLRAKTRLERSEVSVGLRRRPQWILDGPSAAGRTKTTTTVSYHPPFSRIQRSIESLRNEIPAEDPLFRLLVRPDKPTRSQRADVQHSENTIRLEDLKDLAQERQYPGTVHAASAGVVRWVAPKLYSIDETAELMRRWGVPHLTHGYVLGRWKSLQSLDWSCTSWDQYLAHLRSYQDEVKGILSGHPQHSPTALWFTWMAISFQDQPEQTIAHLHAAINVQGISVPQPQLTFCLSQITLYFWAQPTHQNLCMSKLSVN